MITLAGHARHPGEPSPGAHSAVSALARTDNPLVIDPLIFAVSDTNAKVSTEAAKALATISGRNLGRDAAAWQQWWKQNKQRPLTKRHGS